MEQLLDILARVDSKLSAISVRGADTFIMVDARQLLKIAYDSLRKEAEKNADSKTDELDSDRVAGD